MTPLHHCDTFKFGGKVINNGTGTITDVKVDITRGSSFQDSLNFSSISAGVADSSLSATGFLPSAIGDYKVNFSTSISETETDLTNNNESLEFEVTDTIFAREKGTPTDGLGFNGGQGGVKITNELVERLEEACKNKYYDYFAPDGFFWGQQFQEEQVTEYAEQDQKFINWCKDQLKEGQNIGYDCSW